MTNKLNNKHKNKLIESIISLNKEKKELNKNIKKDIKKLKKEKLNENIIKLNKDKK